MVATRTIGLRCPVDVRLAGDARATLAALLPRSADHSFEGAARHGRVVTPRDARGTSDDVPMKPQVLARARSAALSPDAIVCGDSGTLLDSG